MDNTPNPPIATTGGETDFTTTAVFATNADFDAALRADYEAWRQQYQATAVPNAVTTTMTTTPAHVHAFLPWATLYAFPSGEFYAQFFQTEEAAREDAAEAAQEVAGRVVHVMERRAAVTQPPAALVWGETR